MRFFKNFYSIFLVGSATNGTISSASETHLNLASSNFGNQRSHLFSSSVIDFTNASNHCNITGSVDSGSGSRTDSIGRPKIRKSPSDDSLRSVLPLSALLLSARKRVPSFVVYVFLFLFYLSLLAVFFGFPVVSWHGKLGEKMFHNCENGTIKVYQKKN